MGLDMYALITKTHPQTAVDFKVEDAVELHYWRKHPNLHGWMKQLYRDKGGTDAEFNCAKLLLTEGDLDHLEADLRSDGLPETSGFFFGESQGDEIEDDLEFIAKAREAIQGGHAVIYDSWW